MAQFLQKPAQLLRRQASVAKDAVQRAFANHFVIGDNDSLSGAVSLAL